MSINTHTCQSPTCHYCALMKKELSRVIPILPPQYMVEIRKAGGWFEFRDQAIMELSKNHIEIKQAQVRTIARLRQKKRLLLSA